ncbi:MAG TPA: hypothetical protein VFR90_10900 [Methylibium sp.]|uniref:hypothetical protein n=1 Tax=Methylibium sp. TaxID=2067992 RepID=UPI002DC04A61|nr:hypothetical protein [Methylibium sp.]HEU4459620.1 hypothetical protein [Methylibium sp.]
MNSAHESLRATRNRRRVAATLAVASVALLSACFGGGDDDAPAYDYNTAAAPPESAAANSGGFLDFVAALGGSSLEGREPFDLSAFNPPTDNADTLEPARTSIDQ